MVRLFLATPACDPGVSRWIGEVEGGQIRDAHELGMTSAVRSTLAVLPVSPQRISLINGHQGEGRLLFLVKYSEELMVEFSHVSAMFKTCATATGTFDSAWSLAGWGYTEHQHCFGFYCTCLKSSTVRRKTSFRHISTVHIRANFSF